MRYSMCMNCNEQISEPNGTWLHTVWMAVGQPPSLQEQCPSVPNSVATPTEGMIIEI